MIFLLIIKLYVKHFIESNQDILKLNKLCFLVNILIYHFIVFIPIDINLKSEIIYLTNYPNKERRMNRNFKITNKNAKLKAWSDIR